MELPKNYLLPHFLLPLVQLSLVLCYPFSFPSSTALPLWIILAPELRLAYLGDGCHSAGVVKQWLGPKAAPDNQCAARNKAWWGKVGGGNGRRRRRKDVLEYWRERERERERICRVKATYKMHHNVFFFYYNHDTFLFLGTKDSYSHVASPRVCFTWLTKETNIYVLFLPDKLLPSAVELLSRVLTTEEPHTTVLSVSRKKMSWVGIKRRNTMKKNSISTKLVYNHHRHYCCYQ